MTLSSDTHLGRRAAIAAPGVDAADLGARSAAGIFDWILISVGTLVAWPYVIPDSSTLAWIDVFPVALVLTIALHVTVGEVYFTLLEGLWGASVGKAGCGIRVIRRSGERIGIAIAARRAALTWAAPHGVAGLMVAVLPEVWALLEMPAALLGTVAVLFWPARRINGYQTLHDRWTDSRVVPDPRTAFARQPFGRAPRLLALMVGVASLIAALVDVFELAVLGGLVAVLSGVWARSRTAIVIGVSAIVLAVSPSISRPRGGGNEAAAIGSLRTVNSAQATYSASCGGNGYAQSLQDLALPPLGSAQSFISPDLAENGAIKSGYIVTLMPGVSAVPVARASETCNGAKADTMSTYFAEAHPVSVGTTGRRSFATDERGTIYFNNTGAVIRPGMDGASLLQ